MDRVTLHRVESPRAIVAASQETRDGEDGAATTRVTIFIVEPRRAATSIQPLRVGRLEKLKLALLLSVETVTDAGTVSPGLVDTRVTVVGAPRPLRVTVQLPPEPGTTLVGLQASDIRLGPVVTKESVKGIDDEPRDAVMRAVPAEVRIPAEAVKEAVVALARTVTEAGTVSFALLEDRVTVAPPVGAGFDRVTVQGVVALDARLEVVQVREVRLTGPTSDSVAGTEELLREAVTVPL